MKTLAALAAIRDKLKGKVAIRENDGQTAFVQKMGPRYRAYKKRTQSCVRFRAI